MSTDFGCLRLSSVVFATQANSDLSNISLYDKLHRKVGRIVAGSWGKLHGTGQHLTVDTILDCDFTKQCFSNGGTRTAGGTHTAGGI